MIAGNTDYGIHLADLAGVELTEYSPDELEQLGWDNVDDTIKTMQNE